MRLPFLDIDQIETERLILIPFTLKMCEELMENNFTSLEDLDFKTSNSWPDDDFIETLPKLINNLKKVFSPTGFENWMIIKKDSKEVIGDVGFKGFSSISQSCDIGYGIAVEHRKKGYASEALKAMIEWAFSDDGIEEVTASCLITNLNSKKLLERLTFKEIDRDKEYIYWSLQKGNFK